MCAVECGIGPLQQGIVVAKYGVVELVVRVCVVLSVVSGLNNQADAVERSGELLSVLMNYVDCELIVAFSNSQGKLEEAEPLYGRAVAVWMKALGPDHPQVATGLNNQAALLKAMVSC